jgi:hypothetical protein
VGTTFSFVVPIVSDSPANGTGKNSTSTQLHATVHPSASEPASD